MNLDKQAAENLQIIRSLMERSTVYRSISAPTAFIGGVTAILMGLGGDKLVGNLLSPANHHRYSFLVTWGLVFFLTIAAHIYQLYKDSLKNGESIFSSRHFHAFKCMFPSFLTATLITGLGVIEIFSNQSLRIHPLQNLPLVIAWTFFYGMALLSTQTFAPKSIQWLGWAFFATAILEIILSLLLWTSIAITPSNFMTLTFGLFHLIYAVAVWFTPKNKPSESTL